MRKIVTKYDNDYLIGGVTNTFDAVEDTDGLVTFVSTGIASVSDTDKTITLFDDDTDNAGGGVGARVELTAILTGNTTNGGGATHYNTGAQITIDEVEEHKICNSVSG